MGATTTAYESRRQVDGVDRYRKKRSWRPLRIALFYAIVIPFLLIWLVPIFMTLVTAVRSLDDITMNGPFSWPSEIHLDNFAEAWDTGGLRQYMINSFIVTIPALAICLSLSSLAGFALARFRFRGNLIIYFTFVGGSLLPFQILMLPVYRLANTLNLYDTYWALIIFHGAFQIGFCTFVLRNFIRTIPGEIFDAARIDGASEFRLWRNIIVPRLLPVILVLVVIRFGTAMAIIDEYLIMGAFNRERPTYTWTVYMWETAFVTGDWRQGYAAAIGWVGALAMLIVVVGMFYVFRTRD